MLAEGKRPMKIDDLFAFKRVSEPQVSPDGKLVVYVVGRVDLAANKTSSSLWLAATDGKGAAAPLTNADRQKGHAIPRWSPDGKQILFESNRSGDSPIVDHRSRRRRGEAAHDDQHRGRNWHLVAGRQDDRLCLGGLAGIQRQAVQGERRG